MDKKIASQTNRRKSQRRRPRSTVNVECRKGIVGFGKNITSLTLDLSDTGVRLIVTQALDTPGEVELTITGYGMKKPIRRISTIRWQVKLEDGRFCVGVEFQKRIPYRDWQTLSTPN